MTIAIALNRSEHGALAAEGYIGPINQPHVLLLEGRITAEAVREALWQATLAWPRLRAVLAPTWLSWRLEVLPQGPELRRLVDHALRLMPLQQDPADPALLQSLHQDELNTPLCLERGLPWRAWFLPHPQRPVLLLNVHHVVGDGHSMFLIHRSILQSLNGQVPPVQPVEPSTQAPALMPRHGWLWPASAAAWWRNAREDAFRTRGRRVVRLASRTSPRYSISALRHVTLPLTLAEAREAARSQGATINVLIATLLAQGLLARDRTRAAPHAPPPVVDLRVAVDLRRFFPSGQAPRMGNLVGNVTLRALPQADLSTQMADLKHQSQVQLARLERRELALPYRLQDGFALVGRRLLSKVLLCVKARGRAAVPSVFISNLGSAQDLTPDGARVRLTGLWTTSVGVALFVSVASVGDRLQLVFTWQCDETEAEAVDALIGEIQVLCQELRQDAGAPSAATPPPESLTPA